MEEGRGKKVSRSLERCFFLTIFAVEMASDAVYYIGLQAVDAL